MEERKVLVLVYKTSMKQEMVPMSVKQEEMKAYEARSEYFKRGEE